VVCEACHDKVHAGLNEILPVVQTSEGPIRGTVASGSVTTGSTGSGRRSKWTEEQIQSISNYLKIHINVPPKRAVFDLGEQGITISVSSLRQFRGFA